MVYGRHEVGFRHRLPLCIRDRDQRHLGKAQIQWLDVREVLPAMQRRDRPAGHRFEQREMKLIDMEVQNIKFLGGVADPVEHQHVVGNGIVDIGVEPDRRGNAADELRAGD